MFSSLLKLQGIFGQGYQIYPQKLNWLHYKDKHMPSYYNTQSSIFVISNANLTTLIPIGYNAKL